MRVLDGTLLKLRCKGKLKNVVIGVSFLCPCGKQNRRKVGSIVGQNMDTVQFRCGGCRSIVNLSKQPRETEEKLEAAK